MSQDTSGQDERIQHAPSTVQRGQPEDQGMKPKSTQMGGNLGQKAKGVVAGVHVSFCFCVCQAVKLSSCQALE